MPVKRPSRLARTKQLMRLYQKARKSRAARVHQRTRALRQQMRRLDLPTRDHRRVDLEMDVSDDASNSTDESEASDWDSLLRPGWYSSYSAGTRSLTGSSFGSQDDLEHGSELSSEDGWQGSAEDSDLEMLGGDNSEMSEAEDEVEDGTYWRSSSIGRWARLRHWVLKEVEEMYANRYEVPRDSLPRPPSHLHHLLMVLKTARSDKFREQLRVTPTTFDAIVGRIEADAVFTNNSSNGQMPVEEQLAIALYRFGHDGNAASLQAVANWAGVSKGSAELVTRRVITALLRPTFLDEAVRFPTPSEKEEAKLWVERHSCKAWRGGWCMVDGTLVPLTDKPTWFGESYFDRKSRYSLNIQVVSLPNLRIIDFSYGHVGSTHDATAWEETRLAREHGELLEEGEWVWADSAYPINTWIIAPYKKPERDEPDNEVFNNHVSMVRIRSEHAIGFLKGRFHSLKNLRIHINSKRRHLMILIATYWIAACIAVHSYALQCEANERQQAGQEGAGQGNDDDVEDPFILEGLSSSSEVEAPGMPPATGRASGCRLLAAKACRQKLKERLFRYKARKVAQLAERRRAAMQLDSDEE